jgi:predicted nucleotidyltransferase
VVDRSSSGRSPLDFVRRLDAALCDVLDGVVATYVHGSVALGGFVTGRSDVDVLVIAEDVAVADEELSSAAAALHALAGGAPGRGLELSVVAARHAREPGPPWPFLLHVTTGEHETKTVLGIRHAGDPDLLMHYVVCRSAGIAVRGPAPTELIGEVPRADVLDHLEDELTWALHHAPEAYAVLNACRALAYLETETIMSKIDGARYALDREGTRDLIVGAIEMQQGSVAEHPPTPAAHEFVAEVQGLLRSTPS